MKNTAYFVVGLLLALSSSSAAHQCRALAAGLEFEALQGDLGVLVLRYDAESEFWEVYAGDADTPFLTVTRVTQ